MKYKRGKTSKKSYHQIDCFKINIRILKFLGVWSNGSKYYEIYSKGFLIVFILIYDMLLTINFYFVPRLLDVLIEQMMFYFTELAVSSKAFTFFFLYDKIEKIMNTLESPMFTPDSDKAVDTVDKAKRATIRYWRIVFSVSILSNMIHVLSPLVAHIFLAIKLELPVCSYSFLSEQIKDTFIYPLFLYQSIGIHFHMLYNVNIDTYFWGLMMLTIAQLDILDDKLHKVANVKDINSPRRFKRQNDNEADMIRMKHLNQCIVHFDEINKFCSLLEDVFSVTLFIQFSMASCIICVCLFRFTWPAPAEYYIFLATYMAMMVIQILVPCWFGTRIMDTSTLLSIAVYNCDWTPRTRQFKSNLRLFVERANRPLSITGGKMFPLSLVTFTAIMKTAYSFFTLLQHVQSR